MDEMLKQVGINVGPKDNPVIITGHAPVPAMSTQPPMTVEAMKTLMKDALTTVMRDSQVKSEVECLSMNAVSTMKAEKVLKLVDISLADGSAIEPAGKVFVPKGREFDMGRYDTKEHCYEPFFKYMVEYLKTEHDVKIAKEFPYPPGCCRLLDVHKLDEELELEVELSDRTLRMVGSVDAVFVPPKRGVLQYKDSVLGGVEVQHSTEHKEIIPGRALMEALAVYAYSNFPKAIFLLTSFDDNIVMEFEDGEISCWVGLNFAQAMARIAAFLKGEDVREFLDEYEKPSTSWKRPQISETKISVREKLKVGESGNEEFLEQVDAIRSTAGSRAEMISDLFQLMETWRYSTSRSAGRLGNFV